MRLRLMIFAIAFTLIGCSDIVDQPTLLDFLEEDPKITGSYEYIHSPFVASGNRVYMIGHQDGSFPELGWHIEGEMSGIWNHPIKLMDGFDAQLQWGSEKINLDKADSFTNYPFASRQHYNLEDKHLEVDRIQFVPDNKQGIIVQYVLFNKSEHKQSVQFNFTGHVDLRPTWLSEKLNIVDGKDIAEYDREIQAWVVKDEKNPWSVVFGADETPIVHEPTPKQFKGQGASDAFSYELKIFPGHNEVITFFIAGSYKSVEAAKKTYRDIFNNYNTQFKAKQARYHQIAEKTKLTVPDNQINQAFEWLKYNCDWLVREVPEIGKGIGAGLPDYPWWFGVDSEFALQGYMAIGAKDIVYSTIRLLDSISNVHNGNGRIVHEVSTNGVVYNPGNINETPQFASLIWEIYNWTGDKRFLEKYFPTIVKGMDWLLEENDANSNLFPDGFGIMEIHGLDSEMIDVAAYTQKGFSDATKIALELGNRGVATKYSIIAETLKRKINLQFWSEDFQSYGDFIATDSLALELIEDAIVRADSLDKPWAIEELQQTKNFILNNPSDTTRPFLLHHNWVVNTPMHVGIADTAKAIAALNTARKFTNPFGVFVTGIDRDENANQQTGSFEGSKTFSYTGAVMTLPTGVQAIAENNYGRPNEALDYLKRMTKSFSYALPGSMYEVSPDYGMMVQAWNIFSYTTPIIKGFFGIQPQAQKKLVLLHPQMPDEWSYGKIEQLHIGDNIINIDYKKNENKREFVISQTQPGWSVEFILPKHIVEYEVEDGTDVSYELMEEKNQKKLIIKGSVIKLSITTDDAL